MIKNYFKAALRNIRRNKVNSIINISGLSVAMTAVIFIIVYLKDEVSYDRSLGNLDHIFQVNMTVTDKGVPSTTGGNAAPAVTPTMTSMIPK